jgi:hypothetical protein
MAANLGPNVLLCMPIRTKCIPCMAANLGPNVLLCRAASPSFEQPATS